MIAARLDRLAIDKIDAAIRQRFQRIVEIDETREVVLFACELDEEIDVAPRRIETLAARRRAGNLEPPRVEAEAQVAQLLAMQFDLADHHAVQTPIRAAFDRVPLRYFLPIAAACIRNKILTFRLSTAILFSLHEIGGEQANPNFFGRKSLISLDSAKKSFGKIWRKLRARTTARLKSLLNSPRRFA